MVQLRPAKIVRPPCTRVRSLRSAMIMVSSSLARAGGALVARVK
jgi:hypothetical protein